MFGNYRVVFRTWYSETAGLFSETGIRKRVSYLHESDMRNIEESMKGGLKRTNVRVSCGWFFRCWYLCGIELFHLCPWSSHCHKKCILIDSYRSYSTKYIKIPHHYQIERMIWWLFSLRLQELERKGASTDLVCARRGSCAAWSLHCCNWLPPRFCSRSGVDSICQALAFARKMSLFCHQSVVHGARPFVNCSQTGCLFSSLAT